MLSATEFNDEADNAATIAAEAETPSPGDIAQPLLFGRYRTVRELGRGGMGVVLLAHDTVLDLQVALKLIPQTVIRDTEGIVDLKKEVLRGMELTHPGIVRVYSFEQDATTAAIVMEHIQGETLGQKKAARPNRCFDCEEVLPWLEQLCAALDYAHTEARIAHRDLKPGNLMLTPSGRLKVADFGIASSLSDTLSRVSVRADTSGTPPYMSPQQAMGERPTHLDDIYSLGATMFELLAGKPPFFRGNILAQVMHEEPVTITQRRAELGVSGAAPIPDAWEKMIAACLAKDPAARPASGAALLALLKNPERALVMRPGFPVADLHLEPEPAPETGQIQRVHPRPAAHPAVQEAEWNTIRPARRRLSLQPVATFFGLIGTCIGAVVSAVVGPLIKIGLVIAAIWGLLHLKQKWDSGHAARVASEAQERAAEAAEAAPTRVIPTYYPPAHPEGPLGNTGGLGAAPGSGPGHGMGPGPRHRPPPPPRGR